MKQELKRAIESLDPGLFGVKKIHVKYFKKLGIGESNLNYLFGIGNKKLICRVNIDKTSPDKYRKEFNALKAVDRLGVAPKAYYCHPKGLEFPYGFIIIGFVEGKPFSMKKREYSKSQIRQLAVILAELHSQKNIGLPREDCSFRGYLKKGSEYLDSIGRRTNRQNEKLQEINTTVKRFLPQNETHKFGLVHGDICPQNIIETKNGLRLIDWESLQYSDPATDIAHLLTDLGLKGNNLDLFLWEYHNVRSDPGILERAKTYAVLLRYTNFLWEITRSFEIMNKELLDEYLRKTTAQEHINEAKLQFRRLGELVSIPKINIDALF